MNLGANFSLIQVVTSHEKCLQAVRMLFQCTLAKNRAQRAGNIFSRQHSHPPPPHPPLPNPVNEILC